MAKISRILGLISLIAFTTVLALQAPQQSKPKSEQPPSVAKPATPTAAQPAGAPQQRPPEKQALAEQKPSQPSISGVFKLGFINLEQALAQVDEGKKEFGEIDKFVNQKRTQLTSRQDEIEKLRKQLETQRSALNEDARAKIEKDIEVKDTDLRRVTEDAQKELESRRNTVIDRIGKKMQPLINAIAKEQNYAAILIFSPQAAPLYAYIDLDRYDITNEVIKRYNVAHPMPTQSSSTQTK